MIQQKQVTIKGTEYTLTHLPAIKGTRILKQIVKLVGPAFSTYTAGGPDNTSVALQVLFDNLDSVGIEQLVQELAATASKGSMGVNFDMEFAGEYDKLFLLIKEVVEFNFGSVFQMLGSSVL